MIDKENEAFAGQIFGMWNVLRVISDIDKFVTWLNSEKKTKKTKKFFEGYLLFIETCLRSLLKGLFSSYFITLSEDYAFFRANHKGILLDKLPNTCEKIIFLKNFSKQIRLVKQSRNITEFKQNFKEVEKKILSPLELLYKTNCLTNKSIPLNKKDSLRFASIYWTLIYLNQFNNGLPTGYFSSCLKHNFTEKVAKEGFEGYKYSLQFLWKELLGEDYFKTKLVDMDKSTGWCRRFEWIKKKPRIKGDKTSLDSYFREINDKIVLPWQNKIKFNIFSNDVLLFKKKIQKGFFKDLLRDVKEPSLGEKDLLDYKLFWYEAEILDSSGSHIFNGVPILIPLLYGIVEKKLRYGINEKSYVTKFIHPNKSVNGNDYSYGILIQSYGSIFSDFSGWVLFFDCCGDYSGFSGNEHMKAESTIKELEKEGLVEVREMTIPKDKFEKYISTKSTLRKISHKDELIRSLNISLDYSKSIILELMTYYFLCSKYPKENIDWNLQKDGDQIDVMVQTNKEIYFIECKVSLENTNLVEEIKKLKRKASKFKSKKEKIIEFWSWYPISPGIKESLKKFGATYHNLPNELKSDKDFSKKINDIKFVFDKKSKTNYL